MKKFIAVFITIILLILILLTAGFIYLKLNATTIVNRSLAGVLPGAKIGNIEIKYPLTIKLYQISLDKIAEIKEVDVSLNILGLLSSLPAGKAGKLIISKLAIIEPRINIVREENGVLNIDSFKATFSKKEVKDKEPTKKEISIIIVNLIVREGVFYITDKSQKGVFKASVDDINLVISNLVFPELSKTNFKGGCKISMDKGEARIDVAGWIDMLDKSMDGTITINDVDLIYFNRLFSLLFLKDFASANLDALIKLTAVNNDLNIACHLDIYNVFFKKKEVTFPVLEDAITGVPASPTSLGGRAIGDNALSILFTALKPEDNRIKLDFTLKTKLDAPLINKAVLQKAVIKEIKKKLSSLPVDMLKSKTGSIIEGIKGEIKDAGIDVIKDTFRNLKKMFK